MKMRINIHPTKTACITQHAVYQAIDVEDLRKESRRVD